MSKPSEDEPVVDEASVQKHLDEVLAMTDDEVLAGLEAAGVDLAKEKGRAADWYEDIQRSKQQMRAKPKRNVVSILTSWTVGGRAALAAAAMFLFMYGERLKPFFPGALVPNPVAGALPVDTAAEHRKAAANACHFEQWGRCLAELEHAKDLEPASDNDPEAIVMRRKAVAGLVAQSDAGAVVAEPAEVVRVKAFEQCGRMHWQTCIDLLDAAKELDPPGDADEEVKNARALATKVLTAAKDGG